MAYKLHDNDGLVDEAERKQLDAIFDKCTKKDETYEVYRYTGDRLFKPRWIVYKKKDDFKHVFSLDDMEWALSGWK